MSRVSLYLLFDSESILITSFQDLKVIVQRDLERCKRCLIVHDLDLTIKESDIKSIIAKTLQTNKIKFDVRLDETECKILNIIFSHY